MNLPHQSPVMKTIEKVATPMAMTKRQIALQAELDDLLEICRLRGIGTHQLRGHVHFVCTDGINAGSPVYEHEGARADEVTAAGVTAQLSFLREVWGSTKLRRILKETGGVLDAIVRHTSSDPDAIAKDIGRGNVDVNGDVI